MAAKITAKASELREFARRYAAGETVTDIAKAMKTARSTVVGWKNALDSGKLIVEESRVVWDSHELEDDELPSNAEEKIESTESGDKGTVVSVSRHKMTVDEVLKASGVNRDLWRVVNVTTKSWEVPMKLHPGETIESGEDGKSHKVRGADKAKKIRVYHIALKLDRIVPKVIHEGIQLCCKEFLATYKPKLTPFKRAVVSDPHMLEVSIWDHHLAKLAWAPETGHDYNLEIAVDSYEESFEDLINKTAAYNIERIEIPIGQDFIHIDNRSGTTRNGTMMDYDSRYPKIVKTAQELLIRTVDKARRVAPVVLRFIPGNHDETVSWHITDFLSAWFRDCADVTIDTSTKSRKYVHYGVSLIGMAHGDGLKLSNLPLLMMTEARKLVVLSQIKHFEFHTGHLHTRRKLDFVSVDEHCEVTVRILPSLSATDYWHYKNGFVGHQRAAEAYLWSKENGYTGHFNSTFGCTSLVKN